MAVSRRLRFEVLRRDGHACRYCGRTSPEVPLTIDHVIPSALGGSDDPTNLVAACAECNAGKSASSPDADIVANVGADALRWSAAIRQSAAAMLADLARREAQRREFRTEWDGWTFGPKKIRVPLPDGWERSVDNFLATGLPMPILIDSVRKAMQASKVSPGETFRYMCGIAWKFINEMQNRATSVVGSGSVGIVSPVAASELVSFLWGSFPYELNDTIVREWAAIHRAEREGDEEGGSFPNTTTWPDDLCGFIHAVEKLSEDYYDNINTIMQLLNGLPDDRRHFWLTKAERLCQENCFDADEDALNRTALRLAFTDYQRRVQELRDTPFANPDA